MNDQQADLKNLLLNELDLLLQSTKVLNISLTRCNIIGLQNNYNDDQLIEFESLTSRFARTADILTQKVLKTLFMYMQEDVKFFIDRCNLSEKLGFVDSSKELYNIRKLRNDIAHEYTITDITELFDDVLAASQILTNTIQKVDGYINKSV